LFNFDHRFEIHDDVEVLKRMGMAFGLENFKCRQPEDIDRALSLVPQCLKLIVMELSTKAETEAAASDKPAKLNSKGTTDSADQSSRTSPPLESEETPMVIDANDENSSHSTSDVDIPLPRVDAANSLSEPELEADDGLLSDDSEVDNDGSDDNNSGME
jgi:hypothetical protein